MKKKLLIFFLFSLVVLAFVAVAGYLWYQNAIYTAANPIEVTNNRIEVEKGQGLLDIASTLQANSIIKSADALRIYLRLENASVDLQEGTYLVPNNLNVPDLIAYLEKGPKINSISVTIREGLRYDEVADKLESAFKDIDDVQYDKAEFLAIAANPDDYSFTTKVQTFLGAYKPKGKPLEGFLFPDTYTIGTDATTLQIVDLFVSTLIKRLEENDIDPSAQTRLKNFYEVLTMASIVEREARTEKDRRLVADIFIRRIESNWRIDADAPLLYYFKDWTHALTKAQIEDTSNPYNARRRIGMIPTPICNTGIVAIKAVINPEVNNYEFFISDSSGTNHYARTLTEHNQNIAKYL